jgi:hypothetical protein
VIFVSQGGDEVRKTADFEPSPLFSSQRQVHEQLVNNFIKANPLQSGPSTVG